MGAEVFTKEQIDAAEALLVLINPSAEDADQQIGQLRAMLRASGKLDDEDEDEDEDYEHILWLVNDVIDWESGYAVDWKDSRACIESVTALAARWGVRVELAALAVPKGSAVPGLLAEADRQLAAHGLSLWSWDTQSDCYCGWITRAGAATELAGLSGRLGVAIRRADATE